MTERNNFAPPFPRSAQALLGRLGEAIAADAFRVSVIRNGADSIEFAFDREDGFAGSGLPAAASNGTGAAATFKLALGDGSVIGSITAWNRNGRPIAGADVRLLETAAQAVSSMLESEQLRDELDRLKRRLRSDSFLSELSYEVRTPLNGIILMEELLRSTELTEEQSKYIEVIQLSSKSLLAFVNERLDPDKIDPLDE